MASEQSVYLIITEKSQNCSDEFSVGPLPDPSRDQRMPLTERMEEEGEEDGVEAGDQLPKYQRQRQQQQQLYHQVSWVIKGFFTVLMLLI